VLAIIAAAGVGAGFVRGGAIALEAPPDPLEDRRLELLRSLRDLDDAQASGEIEDARYLDLRHDTEERMVRVLRAIDGRGRRAVMASAAAGDIGVGAPVAPRADGIVPPWAVGALIVATVLAVVTVSLRRSATPVATSGLATAASSDDPLAFFEQRVVEQPNDLAARLDLAHRYLDIGELKQALAQYGVALRLNPDDAEANAHVGLIGYMAGRPEDALASVEKALVAAPNYPEALFFEGVILLKGLDRPAEAADAFRAYLAAAPFGEERQTATQLIAEAEAKAQSAGAAGAGGGS
jgi:tetratricopeptide (TPR) repeat protein